MKIAFIYTRLMIVVAIGLCLGGRVIPAATPQVAALVGTLPIPDQALTKLKRGERGTVARVIDGDSLVLESGLKVSLANIQTPKMAWRDRGLDAWPLADQAKKYMQSLCLGKTVQLYYRGDQRDRYGRALAQVEVVEQEDGAIQTAPIWLQHAVVAAGLARVYPWDSHPVDMEAVFTAQFKAQTQKAGIWDSEITNGFYNPRSADPEELSRHIETVQIVADTILKTAIVRGTAYLNFGDDYKTDFTIAIAKPQVKKLKKYLLQYDLDIEKLAGKKIQIIGWIEDQNGPIIWLSDPRRLQLIRDEPEAQ